MDHQDLQTPRVEGVTPRLWTQVAQPGVRGGDCGARGDPVAPLVDEQAYTAHPALDPLRNALLRRSAQDEMPNLALERGRW
jgi:hypothetical protein